MARMNYERLRRRRRRRTGRPRYELWSEAEDRFLAEHYPTMTAKAIGARLGRTEKAIITRARLLGVQKQQRGRLWSKQDIRILTEQYAATPLKELAARLRRTELACKTYACKLNVHKTPAWSKEEDAFMMKYYSSLPTADVAATLGKSVSKCIHRAVKLGIHKNSFHLWSEEEEALVARLYPMQGSAAIARKLGLSPAAVSVHARTRGIAYQFRNRPWNESDDRYLQEHYPIMKLHRIAAHIGRTLSACMARVQRLHIHRRHVWSHEEESYLRANYGVLTMAEMGAHLGRTPCAVSIKAGKLRIRKHVNPLTEETKRAIAARGGKESAIGLAREYGVDPHTISNIRIRAGYRARPTTRLWTKEDDDAIRKLYGKIPTAKLAEGLFRTPYAVQVRAQHLKVAPTIRAWTEHEDGVLLECCHGKSLSQIARLMNRSRGTIKLHLAIHAARGMYAPERPQRLQQAASER